MPKPMASANGTKLGLDYLRCNAKTKFSKLHRANDVAYKHTLGLDITMTSMPGVLYMWYSGGLNFGTA